MSIPQYISKDASTPSGHAMDTVGPPGFIRTDFQKKVIRKNAGRPRAARRAATPAHGTAARSAALARKPRPRGRPQPHASALGRRPAAGRGRGRGAEAPTTRPNRPASTAAAERPEAVSWAAAVAATSTLATGATAAAAAAAPAAGMASGGRRQVELRRGRARVRGGGAHLDHEEVGVAPRHERDAPRTTQSVGGPRRASPLHVDDLDPVSLCGCRSWRDVDGTRSEEGGRGTPGLRGSSKAGLEARKARSQKTARARTPSRERQPLCNTSSRAHRLAAHFLLHCGLLGARRACSG